MTGIEQGGVQAFSRLERVVGVASGAVRAHVEMRNDFSSIGVVIIACLAILALSPVLIGLPFLALCCLWLRWRSQVVSHLERKRTIFTDCGVFNFIFGEWVILCAIWPCGARKVHLSIKGKSSCLLELEYKAMEITST
jgi:hypothetical protein